MLFYQVDKKTNEMFKLKFHRPEVYIQKLHFQHKFFLIQIHIPYTLLYCHSINIPYVPEGYK